MNKELQKLLLYIFLLTVIINNSNAYAQENLNDTGSITDSINENANPIKEDIIKNASDSIRIDVTNKKVYLYGNASIKYENTEILAGCIEIDWSKNIIKANPYIDSSGKLVEYPVFVEDGKTFSAEEMIYNFKTKRSFVRNISTKEGEGYIHGKKVKKTEENIFYLNKADYTTCDAKKPHYSIRSNRVKIIPGKKIVTGPAYLRFFNIPTPIFLPFGFFPNNEKQSSGILIPSYGESENLGFFLKDGGYYFNINDKIDLALRGDIYIKGSWAARSLLRYKKRYKYNGDLNLSYSNIINSERDLPDYSVKKDFFIRWKHQQDLKANPSLLFSANVNAGSSTFHRNNSLNADDFLSNTFQSGISLTKRWVGSPFNLSVNIRHSQNTNTKIVSLSLPEVSLSMNRIFPLRNLGNPAKTNWYDKIGLSYTLNTRNDITIADSLLFTQNALRKFRNGMMHTVPISTSMKVLKYFTLNPRVNLTERWYLSQIEKKWNVLDSALEIDTISKFTRAHSYNLSASLNTKLYGLVQFRKGKIAAIRHVLTPNIGFSFNPDFSHERYGYYKTVQSDVEGNTEIYSIMQHGIFGSPQKNKNGNINLNINNILEMKVRKKDSATTIKKVNILESMNIASAYNIFSDSLSLNDITLNLRTRLLNMLDITFSSRYDPYIVNNEKNGNRNTLELLSNNRLARFISANTSIMLNLSDKTFSKKSNKGDEEEDFYKIPWNLNISYNLTYNKGYQSSEFSDTTQSLNFDGNIKLGKKWKLGLRSGYDFDTKRLTYTSIDIYRDLHCWEMLFHWIPIGFHKSYMLTIRVKANILKDLKIEKKKEWIDPDYN